MSGLNSTIKFGQPIGITEQNVVAFSNDEKTEHNKSANYYNQIYTGIKYECVEFVRRWLIMVYNISFSDVNHAIDIFNLPNFFSANNPLIKIQIKKIPNNSTNISFGDIIIWKKQGHFNLYGHVGVVLGVRGNNVFIGEQNIYNKSWNNKRYSRKLMLLENKLIDPDFKDTEIIGWIKYY